MGAQVSFAQNNTLAAVLSEEGNQARDRLWQELPAAVMSEWETELSVYSALLGRVTHRLKKEGSEQRRLARDGKLAGESADAFGGDDGDLAEFERQETLRQQREQLDELEQLAALPPRQEAVWRRVRQGMKEAEIAAELNMSKNNVYVHKYHAIQRLIEARKAAGL